MGSKKRNKERALQNVAEADGDAEVPLAPPSVAPPSVAPPEPAAPKTGHLTESAAHPTR